MTITPADLDALDQALAAMTPGPWRQGVVTGQCRRHKVPHPGPAHPTDPCVYDYSIDDRGEYARSQIAVAPNVTLVGTDDHGPILNESDAAGIIALVNAAPALLAEVRRLRAAVERHVAECELLARLGREREDAARLDAGNARAVAEEEIGIAEQWASLIDEHPFVKADRAKIASCRERLASPDAEAAREAVDALAEAEYERGYDARDAGTYPADAGKVQRAKDARAAVLAMLGAGGAK